ncbi:hypothetical protein IT575_09735 [bacterium]|nr:hypothetical protein [bacterium]
MNSKTRAGGRILITVLSLLLLSCGAGGQKRLDPGAQGAALRTPQLSTMLGPLSQYAGIRAASTSTVNGGDYHPEMPHSNVSVPEGESHAVLSPLGGGTLADSAYCCYAIAVEDDSLPQLQFSWYVEPSAAAWVALADWSQQRWHWFNLSDPQSLAFEDLPAHSSPENSLLVAVLLPQGDPAELQNITLPALATDFLPDGPRPRLWLTPERLAGLEAARDANTPEWQRFSNEADGYLNDEFWGDLINFTIPFTLLYYKMTGDEQYAARSMELMDQFPLDEWEISCCPYHNQIHNMALGYDWLYDHPAMTPQKKLEYQDKMLQLADKLWMDALNSDGISNSQDTDRVAMAGASLLIVGCALWGDHERAPEIYERGWRMWNKGLGEPPSSGIYRQWTDAQPVRRWIKDFGDGPWPSGWFYATGTDMVGLKDYFITLRTACGYDPNLLEPGMSDTWKNQIRCFLYGMDPRRTTTYSGADWQESDLLSNHNNAYIHSCMAALADEAELVGDTQEAAWARWLVRNIEGSHSNNFREFFFSPGSSPAVDNPFDGDLPLVAFSAGMPHYMYFRDGWDTNARWGIFGGQAGVPCDHPQMDQGHFSLIRGGEYLTRDAPGYKEFSIGAQTYNTLTTENATVGGYCHNSNFDLPTQMERRLGSESPLFAYAMLDAAGQRREDPAWWESDQRVQKAQRHFFWAGDYAVVFDRVRRTDVGWAKYRLRAMTAPSLDGDTISQSSADGSQRLLHRTLEPADCEFSVLDETALFSGVENWQIDSSYRHWQTVIQPQAGASLNMLNVIQMGPASLDSFDANLEHITGNGNSGVLIGPWCVVYSGGIDLRSSVSFSVAAAQAGGHFLVGDLEPGSYTLSISGEAEQQVEVTEESSCALFSCLDGGSLSISLSKL